MNELVLIVDDEPGILDALSGILEDEGYRAVTTTSGDEALELYREHRPEVVFLDIWLPDRDGLETLEALLEMDGDAAVVMMSGHGTASTAVKTIKMGAQDYLEKPLAYDQVVDAVRAGLKHRESRRTGEVLEMAVGRPRLPRSFSAPTLGALLERTDTPQRTLSKSTVVYGLGLHSGGRTGMAMQPLGPDSGIHFVTLPKGTAIPAHVSSVADTDYATSLEAEGESIRTVEHLLSALHAYGITNLLIKVHGEIPVLDGSALEFCKHLESVGVADQDARRFEVVVDRRYEVGQGQAKLVLEPAEGFHVSYLLRYPPPVGEQLVEFSLTDPASYREQIAPARTFGFMRDMKMINELGLVSGGRLDNFILVGEDNVINTELRFPDEFARHKILDIVGDLYLLGHPVRGRVTAELSGHRDNIQVQRKVLKAVVGSATD